MALDHANYMIAQGHSSGEYWGGPFPAYASTSSFLTRLVTHLSAPGFFFLMGAGMALFTQSRRERGWSGRRITGHFLLRGGFLILLQLLVINPLWMMGPEPFPQLYLGVLYALGGTMVLGNLMLNLSPVRLLVISAALFFYILHLWLYLLLGRIFAPQGMSIAAMHPWWFLGLLILLPLTRRYQHYKRSQPADSLLRFL